VSQQLFSDFDGRYNEPVISTFGGLIGEIIILIQAIESLGEEQFKDEQLTVFL